MCKNSTFCLAGSSWKNQYFCDTLKRMPHFSLSVHWCALSKSKTMGESSDQVLLHCFFITWIWTDWSGSLVWAGKLLRTAIHCSGNLDWRGVPTKGLISCGTVLFWPLCWWYARKDTEQLLMTKKKYLHYATKCFIGFLCLGILKRVPLV